MPCSCRSPTGLRFRRPKFERLSQPTKILVDIRQDDNKVRNPVVSESQACGQAAMLGDSLKEASADSIGLTETKFHTDRKMWAC